ncbi:MAG: hypothetical protein Q9161_007078 [Pseudevernia consocians]
MISKAEAPLPRLVSFLERAPLSDLFLQVYGPIPLPLAPRDAKAICKERTEGDGGEGLMNIWLEPQYPQSRLEKVRPKRRFKAAVDLSIKLDTGAVKTKGDIDVHDRDFDDGLHNIENEDDDEIRLTEIVDLGGKMVAGGIPIELDEHFIQSELLEGDSEEENFDYHHGPVTHCYRKTVSSG